MAFATDIPAVIEGNREDTAMTRYSVACQHAASKFSLDPRNQFWFLAAVLALCSSSELWAQSHEGEPRSLVSFTEDATSLPGNAAEPWLYAIDQGSSDGSSTLFRLGSASTGGFVAVEVVGETGVEDIFDIAFMNGRLFGIGPGDKTFGTTRDILIEIDPQTAAVNVIGTIDPAGNFNALVRESPSTLLAASTQGELWRINPDALTATRVGFYGSGFESSGDLALVGGIFYGSVRGVQSDRLVTVNSSTGRATLLGSIGFREVHGLTHDPTSGGLLGLADGDSAPKLISINRSSGSGALIGHIPASDAVTGLASAPLTAPSQCSAGSDALFLEGGRFRIDACWRTSDGNKGTGKVAHQQGAGAVLWFFDPANPELFVKVIDACVPPFNRYWVFVAGLTNVGVEVRVTDQVRGFSKVYGNVLGQTMQSVNDTSSFATCP